MTYLGIDIGGTTAKLGIVTDDGTILARTAVATAGLQDGAAIVDAILQAAAPLVEAHRPAAVGIGSAGRIDVQNGVGFAREISRFKTSRCARRYRRHCTCRPFSTTTQTAPFWRKRHAAYARIAATR